MKVIMQSVLAFLMVSSGGVAVAQHIVTRDAVATTWTAAPKASPSMTSSTAVTPAVSNVVASPSLKQGAVEGRSNGRPMLLGGLLIAVIALRSRKHLS